MNAMKRWRRSQHVVEEIELPMVDEVGPTWADVKDTQLPEQYVFPGREAQLRWHVSAALVQLEVDLAEEALDAEDLTGVRKSLHQIRKVAALGRLPESDSTVPK